MERRRGRGGEGRIRVSSERGSWRKDIMVGAKTEWDGVDWRMGGGASEEGSEREGGIRVRGRWGAKILGEMSENRERGRKCWTRAEAGSSIRGRRKRQIKVQNASLSSASTLFFSTKMLRGTKKWIGRWSHTWRNGVKLKICLVAPTTTPGWSINDLWWSQSKEGSRGVKLGYVLIFQMQRADKC